MSTPLSEEGQNIGKGAVAFGKLISASARIRVLAAIAHAETRGEALAAILAMGYAGVDLLALSRGLLHDLVGDLPGDAEKTFFPNMLEILKNHLAEEGVHVQITIIEKEKP